MKALVVGGAGYIGSHTVYELIRDGHEVIVVDNLSTGRLEDVHKQAKFYKADIRDSIGLSHVFEKEKNIDVVLHFAAKLIVPESVSDPLSYYDNNVNGIRVLLEVMKKYKMKNIVFSSTAAVYGEPQNAICTEEDVCVPINPYGETKLAAEKLIQWTAEAEDLNYCIFRYFNVAGADASGEIGLAKDNLTHLIPVTIQAALGIREKLMIYGTDYNTVDGTCIRDYIHVTDLAQAHILGALYTLESKSGIFNLGSKNGFSVKEIVETVQTVSGLKVPYEYTEKRAGDPAAIIASNNKAVEILNWKINHDLEGIINSDLNFRKKRISAI